MANLADQAGAGGAADVVEGVREVLGADVLGEVRQMQRMLGGTRFSAGQRSAGGPHLLREPSGDVWAGWPAQHQVNRAAVRAHAGTGTESRRGPGSECFPPVCRARIAQSIRAADSTHLSYSYGLTIIRSRSILNVDR